MTLSDWYEAILYSGFTLVFNGVALTLLEQKEPWGAASLVAAGVLFGFREGRKK